MQIDYKGKTILVTGSVRGIGRAISHAFAARGANVHATDILTDELGEVVTTAVPADGGKVTTHATDITNHGAVAMMIASIEKTSASGAIDVVVHSAGGVVGKERLPIEQVEMADWQAIFDVNVNGAFNLVQAVVPAMKRVGDGRIIIISSPAGLRTSLTGIQSYAMSKAAQIGLVRQLAQELGPFGIRVNSVAPGFMASSPDYVRQWNSYGEAGQKKLIEGIPLRRLCRPDDIAHAVLFLGSDYAGFITGQTLPVNGTP